MRLRTSAALALVMTLFASPVAALACGFDCWPAQPAAVVETVEAPAGAGTCHREAEEPVDGGFTLSATPHDCSDHSVLDARLTNPKSSNGAFTSVTSTATLPSALRYTLSAASARVTQSPAHDLAPPGRTPDLIAPLRI